MFTVIKVLIFLLIASPAVAFDFPWGANPWQGAAGAATPTYTMTLAIPASDSTLTVDGTPYTDSGSPHTIPGLSGLVNMVVTYGGTEDTTVFTGTDLADVLGTSPNFSINMDADKSLICTFSTVSTDGEIGTVLHTGASAILTNQFVDYHDFAQIQPSVVGTVRYAHVWVEDSDGFNVCASLNLNSDGTVKLSGSGTRADDSAGWVNIDCGSDYDLLSVDYDLAVSVPDGNVTIGSNGLASTSGYTDNCANTKLNDNAGITTSSPLTVYFDNNPGDP